MGLGFSFGDDGGIFFLFLYDGVGVFVMRWEFNKKVRSLVHVGHMRYFITAEIFTIVNVVFTFRIVVIKLSSFEMDKKK